MRTQVTMANMPEERESHYVQSLARGLSVISAFGPDTPELSLSDVARATGLTRAAARRFLLTLVDLGHVRQDGKLFRLTPRVLTLGYAYLSSLSLPGIAEPHLEQLVREVHESSSMSVLDGHDIVYVARVPTSRIMTVAINVGTRFPAYATSMGRVLLAGLDEPALEEHLATLDLEQFTDHTVDLARRPACADRRDPRARVRPRRPGARARTPLDRRTRPQPARKGRRRRERLLARQPGHPGQGPAGAAAPAAACVQEIETDLSRTQ